jgi:hypothetical protein
MKKRRIVITSLLLLAALALGIGYAATTGHLTLNGVVSTQKQTFDVKFTSYTTKDASEGVTAVPGTLPDKAVSFTINGMSKETEYLTGTFTVTNNNEFPMYITGVSIVNDQPTIFDVSTSWDETTPITLAKDESKTVDVTVTLKKGMSEQIKYYFTITCDATSVAPAGTGA